MQLLSGQPTCSSLPTSLPCLLLWPLQYALPVAVVAESAAVRQPMAAALPAGEQAAAEGGVHEHHK
jgi:hypothetical protein